MFAEAIQNQVDINNDAVLTEMKINAYLEATMRELSINIGESELKVMKESGTSEDLAYLTEEASNGAIDKIKKAVMTAIEAFKEFISRIKDRVVRLVTTTETKETMKKVEKKIKLNPFLAKKKVQVIDINKPLKVISKYESTLDKHAAKVSTGKVKPGESKNIKNLQSKFETEYKAAIMGVAAMTTITVAALVTAVNRDMEALPKGVNKVDAETSTSLKKMASCKAFSEETIAEQQAAMASIISFRAKLGREKSNELVDGLSNKIAVLRKAVGGAVNGKEVKTTTPKDKGFKFGKKSKSINESFDVDLFDDDDLFGESVDDFGTLDLDMYDDGDDLFGESFDDELFDDDLFGESGNDLFDEDALFSESFEDYDDDLFGESFDDELFDDDLFGESGDSFDDDIFGEGSDDSFNYEDDLFGESAGREFDADTLLDAIDDII